MLAALRTRLVDTWNVFVLELRRVFRDPGVSLIFFVAGLAYPFLYNLIYMKNVIQEVPVAVVDMSCTPESREFIHDWNATPEVKVTHVCATMEEAQHLLREQVIHGIMYFPPDYSAILNTGLETARISLYCDMSSFLYMKNVYLSANMVTLDKMNKIQIDRYEAMNVNHELSCSLVQGTPYEVVSLFNPSGGYGTFLVPAMLILILHQTLFFGIAMLCGTAREENKEVFMLPGRLRRYSIFRLLIGRAAAYFTLYMLLSSIDLILVPRIFDLPHVGNNLDILVFIIPFLLSTIFFSMFIGSFQRERETGMVTLLFTSLIFMFISGLSWPRENIAPVWRFIGDLLPSTWGMHGYVHINTMGATVATTFYEYKMLWILTGAYFIACVVLYAIRSRQHDAIASAEDAKRLQHMRTQLLKVQNAIADREQERAEMIDQHLEHGREMREHIKEEIKQRWWKLHP